MCLKKVFTKSCESNKVKAQADSTNREIQGILKKTGKIKQINFYKLGFKVFVMVVK